MIVAKARYTGFLLALSLLIATHAMAGGIRDTKHNLSISGPGPIKAATEDRICIFCHTPHRSGLAVTHLWARSTETEYTPYVSSTLDAAVRQPTGASRICLSCHDGTIALGAVGSEAQAIAFSGGIRQMPPGPSNLGTDLSDDHPVSITYDPLLMTDHHELTDPALLPPEVRLDHNQQLQCTACHDPHEDRYGMFLVMSNQYSELCTTCHTPDRWYNSAHAVSLAWWNGAGPDPWPDSDYTTVAENGCKNCHRTHTAHRPERLLNYYFEEDNCLVCHNGNVASQNIEIELTKAHRHSVQSYTGVHDAAEDFQSGFVLRHVECEDCHNPHQANSDPSPGPPLIAGSNKGVSGVDVSGQFIPEAFNEYEICLKCHGDNNLVTTSTILRQVPSVNTRLAFQTSNPSFHPVFGPGINPDVPSLLAPLTVNSTISCMDCHNNDDAAGPRGPHGSRFRHLLERNYTTADFTTESSRAYALCYKCHSRSSILSDVSFSEHNLHIVEEDAPCSACHDPHGISGLDGNPINNSHLINFDRTIVAPDPGTGRLEFIDGGTFAGQCFLSCHGEEHDPESY